MEGRIQLTLCVLTGAGSFGLVGAVFTHAKDGVTGLTEFEAWDDGTAK